MPHSHGPLAWQVTVPPVYSTTVKPPSGIVLLVFCMPPILHPPRTMSTHFDKKPETILGVWLPAPTPATAQATMAPCPYPTEPKHCSPKTCGLPTTTHKKRCPEEKGLVRSDGWPVAYEQLHTGKFPEFDVFNQLVFEAGSAVTDIVSAGVLPWTPDVDYVAPCFAMTTSGLHVAFEDSGPGTGNATDPDTLGQTVWRLY